MFPYYENMHFLGLEQASRRVLLQRPAAYIRRGPRIGLVQGVAAVLENN